MGFFMDTVTPKAKILFSNNSLLKLIVPKVAKLLYIHIPVPFIFYFRRMLDIDRIYIILFIFVTLSSQFFGKFLKKKYLEKKYDVISE